MLEKLKKVFFLLKENRVVSGSFVMVFGGFLISLSNYLYHLIVARLLGPKDYGLLDSLISILYQLSIPLATASTVITKYVASFKGQNRKKTIESFFWKLNKRLIFLTPVILIALIISTPFITNFLHLPSPFLFLLIVFSFILGTFSALGKSFLQGLSRFTALSVTGIFEGFFRLAATILLLFLGWGLLGAIFPYLAMTLLSLLLTLFLVRGLLWGEKTEPIPEKKEIFAFIFPVFFTNLGITSLITSDIVLVRHFLPATEAGFYAALSTLGKIIYFAAAPVMGVIFPIVSEMQAAAKSLKMVTLPGLAIIGMITGAFFALFSFFPRLMIFLLFGQKYLVIEPFVIYFALGMSLYTINVTLLNISLALRRILPTIFVSLAALFQIILIILFHQSIMQIVNIFIGVSALLLVLLLLYYLRSEKG